jgi:GST-like protein
MFMLHRLQHKLKNYKANMIKFYFNTAPNPMKIALFLEESGLEYSVIPIDTKKGAQHTDEYRALNPNSKVPAIDDDGVIIFDSNAILLYLAEKSKSFLPEGTPSSNASLYSWLMFVATGVGPFSGQAVHFRHFAPQPQPYALNRYDFEAWRHWNILDSHLSRSRYMLGNTYGIVDMAVWGWARVVPFVLGVEPWEKLPNVKRWLDEINSRPAAKRAESLKNGMSFKTEMDDQARHALFPQNQRLGMS